MLDDYQPIICDLPRDWPYANIYFLHDVHIGNIMHQQKRFEDYLDMIASDPYGKVAVIGDMMETVIVGSKGDIFRSISPHEQKELCAAYLDRIKDKIICVTDGNHERRITKQTGTFPLYDVCCRIGIENKFRPHFCFVDLSVGTQAHDHGHPVRYTMFCVHKAKDQKNFSTSDTVDGLDIFVFGHDHSPIDHPRGRLYYNRQAKVLQHRNVEVLNAGSFLSWGEYSADSAYRCPSSKLYSLRLHGGAKRVDTFGFYI